MRKIKKNYKEVYKIIWNSVCSCFRAKPGCKDTCKERRGNVYRIVITVKSQESVTSRDLMRDTATARNRLLIKEMDTNEL